MASELSVITISTRTPSKWRFVDMETGEVWAHPHDKFVRSDLHGVEHAWNKVSFNEPDDVSDDHA